MEILTALAEILGVSPIMVIIIVAVLAILFLILKRIAPRTKTEWDDSVIDVIEGVAKTLGVDPEELAKKSLGQLKQKTVKWK